MFWKILDYLFGWTIKEEAKLKAEERNAKLMEIRQNVAAKCIQRAYRSFKERNEKLMEIRRNVAAKCIQRAYRSYMARKLLRKKKRKKKKDN